MLLKTKLSSIYHPLFPDLLDLEIPEEKFADCSNCHQCVNKRSPLYHTKCCTYHPVIPNYMIGAILTSEDPLVEEGISRILKIIEEKKGVTPYGIIPPLKFDNLYKSVSRKYMTQSQANDLKCPLYDNGYCTIWSYRTELCSTFFCMSVGGKTGLQFWSLFHEYFTNLEQKLSRFTMQRLGYSNGIIQQEPLSPQTLMLDDENGVVSEDVYEKLWASWNGNEIEFYKKCYEIIKTMKPKEVGDLLGDRERNLEAKIRRKAILFNENIVPDILLFNDDVVLKKNDHSLDCEVEFEGDILLISPIQYKFIKLFDGKIKTEEILRKAITFNSDISKLLPHLIKAGALQKII